MRVRPGLVFGAVGSLSLDTLREFSATTRLWGLWDGSVRFRNYVLTAADANRFFTDHSLHTYLLGALPFKSSADIK